MKSVPPPAGNEQIIRMGRCGQVCAEGGVDVWPTACTSVTIGKMPASASVAARLARSMRMYFLPMKRPPVIPAWLVDPLSLHGGGDRVSHFRGAGLPTQTPGQGFAGGDHGLHRCVDAPGCRARVRPAAFAA